MHYALRVAPLVLIIVLLLAADPLYTDAAPMEWSFLSVDACHHEEGASRSSMRGILLLADPTIVDSSLDTETCPIYGVAAKRDAPLLPSHLPMQEPPSTIPSPLRC